MATIVIMPGGFHPFHAGHAALYNSARRAFPDAEVFVAATNDTSTRPFPFAIKEKLAKLAGVEPGHFVQVKSPFRAEEITAGFNPEQDVLIFVRSEKDSTKPPQAGGVKKDGSPAYLQPLLGAKRLEPFARHAYMAYLPTVEFGPGFKSATEIRNSWPNLDERQKTALVMSLYPRTQSNPKLAATVRKMLDTAIVGKELNEFAPNDSGDSGQEDMFFKYAKLWYNGNLAIQQRIEQALAEAGWEIGELESEEGGAFIVQSGDEDGDTYMGWPAKELQGIAEGYQLDEGLGDWITKKIDDFVGVPNIPPQQVSKMMKSAPANLPDDVAEKLVAKFMETERAKHLAQQAADAKKTTVEKIVPYLTYFGRMFVDRWKQIPQRDRDNALKNLVTNIGRFFMFILEALIKSATKREGVEENQGWAATFTNEEMGQMAGTPATTGMVATYQKRENQPIDEDYVEEKWSERYKRSINCSNPKGFSQRAHCAGRKK
jgi:hypothetical protein